MRVACAYIARETRRNFPDCIGRCPRNGITGCGGEAKKIERKNSTVGLLRNFNGTLNVAVWG